TFFSLNNIIRNNKIIPDNDNNNNTDPPPVSSAKISTSSVPPIISDPDCQILNRNNKTVNAVPIQTRPPSPCPDNTKKTLDTC
ncbi:hypothetical protein DF186_14850, partial [Enterococcus hirae]